MTSNAGSFSVSNTVVNANTVTNALADSGVTDLPKTLKGRVSPRSFDTNYPVLDNNGNIVIIPDYALVDSVILRVTPDFAYNNNASVTIYGSSATQGTFGYLTTICDNILNGYFELKPSYSAFDYSYELYLRLQFSDVTAGSIEVTVLYY